MNRFFDDSADLNAQLKFAEQHVLPFIDMVEAQVDPVNHVKVQTALFIIFTQRAIDQHGLKRERAHDIIDALFDAYSPVHPTT